MPILRPGYHNTRFGPQWTIPDYDVVFVGIIAAFCTLYVAFLILLPSFKMNMSTLYFYIMITLNLWIGWVIIDCNWAYEWQTSTIDIETFYAPYDPRKINATLGLHMGLRGFNITLVGNPKQQFGQLIDYNEAFWWSEEAKSNAPWHQGRFGFGPFGAAIAQKFREWQFRGYPAVITELAEYFTLDGEDIRWGRWYRIAGWYSHILLWTALPLWALTNAIFIMKPSTGSLWLAGTGLCMITVVMTYGIIVDHNNKHALVIPYSGGTLKPEYGWSWYLVMFTGILAMFLGIGIFTYMMYHPELDHNLLDERPIDIDDEAVEKVKSHEEETIPFHRRRASQYGFHTVVKRAAPVPDTAVVVETPIDKASSPMMATAPPMMKEPIVHRAMNENGDVEMVPIGRMISASHRNPNEPVVVDEVAVTPGIMTTSDSNEKLELI